MLASGFIERAFAARFPSVSVSLGLGHLIGQSISTAKEFVVDFQSYHSWPSAPRWERGPFTNNQKRLSKLLFFWTAEAVRGVPQFYAAVIERVLALSRPV